MTNPIKRFFQSKLKLVKGTRFISFLFIGTSILIGAGILWAANVYYNIDTAEVVMEEVQRVTGVLRATAGVIVGGTASQNPTAGYAFEVVGQTRLATTTFATGTVELTAADQELKFAGGTGSYYVGLKGPTTVTSTKTYILPQHGTSPPVADYVLTWQTGDQLQWKAATSTVGAGDITAVGDVALGAAFTGADTGNTLYFEGSTPDTNEIILTAVDPGADYTITLPAATGYIALGSSTANYVAYWTGTNTLNGEQYLATSRGGIGESSASWNGMVNVVGGNWGTTTGTTNYAAYWSDANTVAAEANLSVIRGGTGAGTFTQYGIIYGNSTSAFGVTTAGTADYLLVGAGAASPAWKTISQLLAAGTNISLSGSTSTTIATVNDPVFSTSVTSPQFLSTAGLLIQSAAGNITINSSSGKIVLGSTDWIETNLGYEIGKPGTQVLIEMIPIMGFDLPAQTATTSYVKISRTIQDYPFSATTTGGTTRIHKFVIRYTDYLPLASSTDWRVATTTGFAYASFTLPGNNNLALDSGIATTTGTVAIPTDGTDWWLEVKSQEPYDTHKIRVFQIFLAAYDQIQ